MDRPEIEIPDGGAYFWANQCRFHISTKAGLLVVRCVKGNGGMSGVIHSHMPAGNVIEMEVR